MVSGSISPFLSKCFSPFPHGTGSLSVSSEYLALPDGPGGFAQNSSCSALLRIPLCQHRLRVRGFHPLWPHFPVCSTHLNCATSRSYNPGDALPRHRFGLFPVRSPLLGESFIFQFPALASTTSVDDRPSDGRVVPFGDLRINGHLHLPGAFRSLSRPS